MTTKRISSLVGATSMMLIMASCSNKASEAEHAALEASRDSLQLVIAQQDSLLNLINDISAGMEQIKQLENIVTVNPDLSRETPDRRQDIINDIIAIQQTINERQARLAELEDRLNRSNANNATLKRTIATLKEQIASQESTIAQLQSDLASANIYIDKLTQNVDSLNTRVASTIEERNEVMRENVDLTNELNTCYYAIGSKSELKEHNLISTGFLRKTKIMPDDFQQNYFTVSDKRSLTTIELHSKKASVLTSQPSSSYEIVTDDAGMKVLNITNPNAFWAKSNYLIIQID